MDLINFLFGTGKDLTAIQMCCRGIIIFIFSLLLIRISGRRSFGVRTPLDNIIVILLGALLSRAVVGASPFWSVTAVSFIIVVMHRLLAWGLVHSSKFSKLIEGDKMCLYQGGQFIEKNMNKGLVCKEDVMQGVRKSALTDDLGKIKAIYIERNGEISPLKNE